jgi:ribosomal protein S18 acetylase RimI-like enzyme
MTTTLRPTGPLQQTDDGTKSRTYEICVNSRSVGGIRIATDPDFGPAVGVLRSLRVEKADQGRGRGTVAVLAAEEVLRGWGCGQVRASVPADAAPALRLTESLGYTERSSNMLKELPQQPPGLPAGVQGRPMTEAEYQGWYAQAVEEFARFWIGSGMTPELARGRSEAAHRESLRDGLATPGADLRVLVQDGNAVGHVWIGQREVRAGETGSYVYDVKVTEGQRGNGFGRALMLVAEQVAHANGTPLLGLHVFSDNTPARRLYESLQYATTHRNFSKILL